MSTETTSSVTQQPAGALKKGRGFLWALTALLAVVAVCAWVSLAIGLSMDVERQTRIILAVVAAFATEALFWSTAASLGVTVFEARRRIWRRITGRGGASA